jgi:hypothetical protein
LKAKTPQSTMPQPLRVFLCHASEDKGVVRGLCARLRSQGVDPWLDEEQILPGQEWEYEIDNAVRNCDVVLVCLSQHSINKSGYVQKEIKAVLDIADELPQGAIFVVPCKLDDCEVPFRLRRWQWVDLLAEHGVEMLERTLAHCTARLLGRTAFRTS